MKKVSLILLTLDRYDITKKVLTHILPNTRYNYELLVADNGSKDHRVIDYIASLNPAVHILNGENKGIQHGQNQLLEQSTGDFLCFIGNDIMLPNGWLSELVRMNELIPKSGISGLHCVMHKPDVSLVNGNRIRRNNSVFGTMFFNRDFFNNVGYVYEGFHPYGKSDSELAYRSERLGYINYYLANKTSQHIGHDVGEKSDYRLMKDLSLSNVARMWNDHINAMDKNDMYYYKPNWIK